jgi:hypothetical protein
VCSFWKDLFFWIQNGEQSLNQRHELTIQIIKARTRKGCKISLDFNLGMAYPFLFPQTKLPTLMTQWRKVVSNLSGAVLAKQAPIQPVLQTNVVSRLADY